MIALLSLVVLSDVTALLIEKRGRTTVPCYLSHISTE